jgi:hypothetical protein
VHKNSTPCLAAAKAILDESPVRSLHVIYQQSGLHRETEFLSESMAAEQNVTARLV